MNDEEILQLFMPLWSEVLEKNEFYVKKPLLAHYTSIHVLERMLSENEVWFSNPLFMNDISEVKFGVLEGTRLVMESELLPSACGTPERASRFKQVYEGYFENFANNQVMDTYIFCLSEHDPADTDGILSMWRGYGSNGNGAAVVFDTAKIDFVQGSPLIIAKVDYASTEQRLDWLKSTISKFAQILQQQNISDDKLHLAAWALFDRIKIFSLYTKHHGFKEENEWRITYLVERDLNKKLTPMFHYWVGPNGLQPKLKMKIEPIEGLTQNDLSLEKLIDKILLGPSVSSPLAKATVLRMMEKLNRTDLMNKVHASTIPFRSN